MFEEYISSLQKSLDELESALTACHSAVLSTDTDDSSADKAWEGEIDDDQDYDEASIAHLIEQENSQPTVSAIANKVIPQSESLLNSLQNIQNHILEIPSDRLKTIDQSVNQLIEKIKNLLGNNRSTELETILENTGVNEIFARINTQCDTLRRNFDLMTQVSNLALDKLPDTDKAPPVPEAAVSSKAEAIDLHAYEEQRICDAIKEMATTQIQQADFKDCTEEEYLQLESFYLSRAQEHILVLIERLKNEFRPTTSTGMSDRNALSETLSDFDKNVIAHCGNNFSKGTHSAWLRCTNDKSREEKSTSSSEYSSTGSGIFIETWEATIKSEISEYLGNDEAKVDETIVQNILKTVEDYVLSLLTNNDQIPQESKIILLRKLKTWLEAQDWFNEYSRITVDIQTLINTDANPLPDLPSAFSQKPSAKEMEEAVQSLLSPSNLSSDVSVKSDSLPPEQAFFIESWKDSVVNAMKTAITECESEVKEEGSALTFGNELKSRIKTIIMDQSLPKLAELNHIIPEAKCKGADEVLTALRELVSKLEKVDLGNPDHFLKSVASWVDVFKEENKIERSSDFNPSSLSPNETFEEFENKKGLFVIHNNVLPITKFKIVDTMADLNDAVKKFNRKVKEADPEPSNPVDEKELITELKNIVKTCTIALNENKIYEIPAGVNLEINKKLLFENSPLQEETKRAIGQMLDEFTQNLENIRNTSTSPMDVSTQDSASSRMDENINSIEHNTEEMIQAAVSAAGFGLIEEIECYIRKNQALADTCTSAERLASARDMLEFTESMDQFLIAEDKGAKELPLAMVTLNEFIKELEGNTPTNPMDVSTQNSASSRMDENINSIEHNTEKMIQTAVLAAGFGLIKGIECYIRKNQALADVCSSAERLASARKMRDVTIQKGQFMSLEDAGYPELLSASDTINHFINELDKSVQNASTDRKRTACDSVSESLSPKRQKKSTSQPGFFPPSVSDSSSSSKDGEIESAIPEEETIGSPTPHM